MPRESVRYQNIAHVCPHMQTYMTWPVCVVSHTHAFFPNIWSQLFIIQQIFIKYYIQGLVYLRFHEYSSENTPNLIDGSIVYSERFWHYVFIRALSILRELNGIGVGKTVRASGDG